MKKSYVKYLMALLLLGSNGIVAGNIDLPSAYIVLYRTFLGSLLLLALYLIGGNRFTFRKQKRDLICILASGIAMGASWMFLYEAYQQIGVSMSSLLYYCAPAIVMMLSPLLFKERLTLPKIVGILTVLAGILLVNGRPSERMNIYGISLGLLSAVMFAAMVITNKKATKIIGLENALLQLAAAFLTVTIFVLCKNGFWFPAVQTNDIAWILVLGLLNTGLGCYLYFSSICNLPIQSVAVLGYIEPLAAVIFSVVILEEVLRPLQILGAVLIIGGAIIGEGMSENKKAKTRRTK